MDNYSPAIDLNSLMFPPPSVMDGVEVATHSLPAFGNSVTGDFCEVKAIGRTSTGIVLGLETMLTL
jgi:hypothetical protein